MKRIALALFALLFAAPVYAQFSIPGSDTAISIALDPAHPGPNTSVHLSLSSPLYDLENSSITWVVNGRPQASGIGLSEITLTTGSIGEEISVSVDIRGDSGAAHAEATIIPTTIDLLWEASSYTPPFYRGRALPSAGSAVTVVALPHFTKNGKAIAAADLKYTWKRDGEVLAKYSGRGKSSATIEAPTLFGASTITVEASLPDGSISGRASARLSDVAPKVLLYADHPLFGILYNSALQPNSFVGDAEMSFAAVPLFSPVLSAHDPNLQYEWTVNRTPVASSDSNPDEITINAAKSTGLAQIQLSLTHRTNYFFNADATWNVTFTTSGSADGLTSNPFRPQ